MLRFRHAIALKRRSAEKSWTEVCLEAGYYDQAHFISECQALVGSSPSRFMRELAAIPKATAAAWYGPASSVTRRRSIPAEARTPLARDDSRAFDGEASATNYSTFFPSFGARV
jgi:hypothetical protein